MSTAENKALVLAFYQQAFNDREPEQAATHLGAGYTQHNPTATDGAEGFVSYMKWLHGEYPDVHLDIKRAIAEDDLVVTHSNLHFKPGDRGMAAIDILRIADGKIVEHWDVMQDVPEKSANDNTMF